MTKIIAICGKSGAGKDTIMQELLHLNPDWKEIISHTTRPKREYEEQGREYYFVSEEDFKELIEDGNMLEYTIFNDWYYGTSLVMLDPNKINIGVFNPEGLRSLLKYNDVLEVIPIYIMANDKERLLRSLMRENNPDVDEIIRRYGTDKADFDNLIDTIPQIFIFKNNNASDVCSIADMITEYFGQNTAD